MNKKRYITIFVLLLLVTLSILVLTKINSNISYKNKSYSGQNENWNASLEVRDKQLDIKITPKILIDKYSKIQCKIKTSHEYSSSGTLYYGSTTESFRATVPLIVAPINYKDEIIIINYNNKEDTLTLSPIKE